MYVGRYLSVFFGFFGMVWKSRRKFELLVYFVNLNYEFVYKLVKILYI